MSREADFLNRCIAGAMAKIEADLSGVRDDDPDGPRDLEERHFQHVAELAKHAVAEGRMRDAREMVKDLKERAEQPARRAGGKVLAAAHQGGTMRQGRTAANTAEIVAFVDAGGTYGQAARRFGLTRDAVKKRYRRARNSRKKAE